MDFAGWYFLLADRELDLDRVDGRHGGEHGCRSTRSPICARLIPAMPLIGELTLVQSEVEARLLDVRLRLEDRGLVGLVRYRVVGH
ncbi:MAG: hypothetical protein U1F09_16485 [Steroidobacteraceae bacterium]